MPVRTPGPGARASPPWQRLCGVRPSGLPTLPTRHRPGRNDRATAEPDPLRRIAAWPRPPTGSPDPGPFTNNSAERAVRPVKVQQRSSGGCWRTLQGLADFAVVQSYLSTAARWGITRLDALHRLFNGDGPWIPTALTPPTATARPPE
jgi:transposase